MNKTGTKRLETDRLILRRFAVDDAEDMYKNWASDAKVTEFLTWAPHPNADFTRQLLKEWISKYEDDEYFNWVIELKEKGQVIGNISVVHFDERIEAAEIGYCMSKSYWGQGIMAEALRAVIDYLFDVVELNRVAACHDVNNAKSGRVMEKAGMKLEGTLRATGRNNKGILYDKVWHSIIKSDRG
ncbi:MAG: GNAT family N-acetyltransferase [Butyrivibrio sp.]|nr:GNAT family N-acetyltransferase [Butyrivibrio sp.]